MSLYRYIPNPNAATSSITGPRTNLVQVPSDYADVALPFAPAAAAASPIARQFGSALLMNLLAEGGTNLIGTLLSQAGPSPSEGQGSSGSRFMIPLQDVRDYQSFARRENAKCQAWRLLGGQCDMIDAEDVIRNRENELRESAAQAGQRELQKARLAVEEATRPEIARAMGAIGSSLAQSTGGVLQEAARTPSFDNYLAQIAQVTPI